MKLKGFNIATLILFLTLFVGAIHTPAGSGIAITGESLEFHHVAETEDDFLPHRAPLNEFVYQVANGRANQVVGLFADKILSFPVLQQPADNPGYVTHQPNTVTQFGMASQYGSTGILAHNTLAGLLFYYLTDGQQISLVYGDGSVQHFIVTDVLHVQALNPHSAYSSFVDLDHGGSILSAEQLFYQVYATENRLVLQTCLFNKGNPSWGRLFVIAAPVGSLQLVDYQSSSQG
ncbi:MAG TPA: hypothetical protein G4O08_08315 [Anaerolineae bacterium]|nr:hypothetical protein [Anaerolineae bacterium]